MSIRVKDLYPPLPPLFEPGTSPLDREYANKSAYSRLGEGHQTLVIGDTYIAGSIPPTVQHNQCINVEQPQMGSNLTTGAYVFISNIDIQGRKHYIRDFEQSFDFVSVYNDLSSRKRLMLPVYTDNLNDAAIFRIFPSNSNQRHISWDTPILLETKGTWLSPTALNYRVMMSGLSEGFPATESFYQIEGDVSSHLLYGTPNVDTKFVKSGQIFRMSNGEFPVIGQFGCNWAVDFAGTQDLNIISNSMSVARSSNYGKWYDNKCLLSALVFLLLIMVVCILYLLKNKR